MNTSKRRSDRYCKIFEPIGLLLAAVGVLTVFSGVRPDATGLAALIGGITLLLGWLIIESTRVPQPFGKNMTGKDFVLLFVLKFVSPLIALGYYKEFASVSEKNAIQVILVGMLLAWVVFLQIKACTYFGQRLGSHFERWLKIV